MHGNAKKKETCPDGSKDENVFDIQQGVSINLFIKNNQKKKGQLAEVNHADLYGKRESKYTFLAEHGLDNINFNKVTLSAPMYFFVPKDFTLEKTYNKGFALNQLFVVNNVGIVTANDKTLINNSKKQLSENVEKTYNISVDVDKMQKIQYRVFDERYVFYDEEYIERPRQEVMRHFINHENYALLVCKQYKAFPQYHHVFIGQKIFESSIVSNKTSEISYGFPLYLYDDIDNSRRPNFNSEIIQKFADGLKLQYVTEKSNQEGTFAPLDVLDYIYAVLHSPKYRETYKEFLKIDFPRIPYPKDKSKFRKLVALGSELRKIHLLESDKLNTLIIGYPVSGSNVVEKITFAENKVYINSTQYFDNVPDIAWNFYIGGYQPAQKWLKDRKNQELTFDDICHYQKIINALYLTDAFMQQIDAVGVI